MKLSPMSYTQIKWLILLIPTITVGIWEFIRHTPIMLRHLSMEAGNLLTPLIVFVITIVLVRKLFEMMEEMQKKLEEERATKVLLEEREKVARQLHDGIAQSLFLLSVKLNQWSAKEPHIEEQEQYQKVRKTVQHVNDDVRQSIFNLRDPSSIHPFPWIESLQQLVVGFQHETELHVRFQWGIAEEQLTIKEKIELYACIKESLMNVRKHAKANEVSIVGQSLENGWICTVEDNGVGFTHGDVTNNKGYGMEIMRDRSREMGWEIHWGQHDEKTTVKIQKVVKKQ